MVMFKSRMSHLRSSGTNEKTSDPLWCAPSSHLIHSIQLMHIILFFYLTDSTTMVSWLKRNPKHLKASVGNKVYRILEMTDVEPF